MGESSPADYGSIVVGAEETLAVLPPLPPGQTFYLHDRMFPPVQTTNDAGELVEEPPKPWFTVNEVAKVFFGKGADWLRWRMKPAPGRPHGYFVLDGEPLPVRRIQNNPNARYWHRYFTLADIERMAHALAQNGGLDARLTSSIVGMAVLCARTNGVDI